MKHKNAEKHPHAEMIKAKVDNINLVVLCRDSYNEQGCWDKTNQLPIQEEFDYFLCRPKHAKACLHALNGGEAVTCRRKHSDLQLPLPCPSPESWSALHWYMDESINSRIKPKKEKRWIVVYGSNAQLCSKAFSSYGEAEGYKIYVTEGQIIEIEIEVE